MKKKVKIDGRLISPEDPPYIIAELSANHNGDLQRALDTITAAHDAGADAVKLQTYTADTMTIDCERDDFLIKDGPWGGYKLYDLYKWAETPFEWHQAMFKHAREIGITVFSTPFDESAVDLLEELDAPAYKIASFEMTDLPLLRRVAATERPVIISTGMASEEEISESIDTLRSAGCTDLIVLHCISSYPAPMEQANLAQVPEIARRFGVLSGLSDHTLGTTASVASVALGAVLIEKHFTLSRADNGPDSHFSIEPQELKQLCNGVRDAWQALGKPGYQRQAAELGSRIFRRSLYFVHDVAAGAVIGADDVRRIRPGYGLAPKYHDDIVGKRAAKDIERGTAVSWALIDR